MSPRKAAWSPFTSCEVRGCTAVPSRWRHGRYCLRHARMMAPKTDWAQLGIPASGDDLEAAA